MQLIVILTAIAVAVWSAYLLPRVSLILTCGLYLVVASALGYEFLHFEVAGISLSLDRLLLLGLFAAYAVQRNLGLTAPQEMPRSEKVLLAWYVLLIVNTFLHDWRTSSYPGQVPVIPHLIEGYLIPLALYWIARRAALRARDVQGLYGMFIVFGSYLAVTACLEISGAWGWVFPPYIANPDLGIHFGRARGPYLQSVRLGIYLLVGLSALWISLVWQRRQGRTGVILGLGGTALYLGALLLTYTRSIWLGVALGGLLTAWLTFPGRFRKLALVGMLSCGVLVLAVNFDGLMSIKREFGAVETRQSAQMRAVFTYVSWLMFKDRPLTGCGFGQFPRENVPYLNDRGTSLQMQTIRGYIHHNTFLSVLVELGLFALLLYVAVLWGWGRRAWLLWQDHQAPDWMRGHALCFLILLVAFVVQAAFHDVTYSPLENGVLFLMAGLMSSMCTMRGISAWPHGIGTTLPRCGWYRPSGQSC